MLTGDKMDTAKSIAFSCKLISHKFKIIQLNERSKEEEIEDTLKEGIKAICNNNNSKKTKFALIIGFEELNKVTNNKKLLDLVKYILIINISFMNYQSDVTQLSAVESAQNKKLWW
jgi:magnesium-transporting ATPase (P-type)